MMRLEIHFVQEIVNIFSALSIIVHDIMDLQYFHDCTPNTKPWIERAIWILEDDLKVFAQCFERAFR